MRQVAVSRSWTVFGLMLAMLGSRDLAFIASGMSLLALGISILALLRASAGAVAQDGHVSTQAGQLGYLKGRAAEVEQKLGGGDGD